MTPHSRAKKKTKKKLKVPYRTFSISSITYDFQGSGGEKKLPKWVRKKSFPHDILTGWKQRHQNRFKKACRCEVRCRVSNATNYPSFFSALVSCKMMIIIVTDSCFNPLFKAVFLLDT